MAHDILIVDDEDDIRLLIAGILKDEGYEPREARDDVTALAEISARRPNLVVLDIWLEGSNLDGLEILDLLRRDHETVPVLMISGHGSIETAVQAIKRGAYDFIEKPFKADRLLLMVERAIESARMKREIRELRLRAGGAVEMVGISTAQNQLRAAVDKVAPTGSRVLITGPAGSGKEVVARLLHNRSQALGLTYDHRLSKKGWLWAAWSLQRTEFDAPGLLPDRDTIDLDVHYLHVGTSHRATSAAGTDSCVRFVLLSEKWFLSLKWGRMPRIRRPIY